MHVTRLPAALLVATGSLTVLAVLAGPAQAHVTVHSFDAVVGGGDVQIDFRVPNEESTAATVKVVIALPPDEPVAGVYAEAKAGWTATETSQTLKVPIVTDDGNITTAVTEVTWTATAGGIPAGGFGIFSLAAGQLPKVETLTFKALQTYSNGDLVSWIQTGDAPDHPAPVLALAAAPASPQAGATAPVPSASPGVPVPATGNATVAGAAASDTTATALGGTGLGLGVVALLVAGGAFLRSGRRAGQA